MGYLNNSTVVVDAILTKKGRELLAKGKDFFNVTKFALADDEIDYTLWNTAHPLGTNFYGIIIDNMPILEAVPDETQSMRYKLITLPKNSARIPIVDIGQSSVVLNNGQNFLVTPQTINFEAGNSNFGYTAILSDNEVADIRVAAGKEVTAGGAPTVPTTFTDESSNRSVSAIGFAFEIVAKQLTSNKNATLTIIGNETGGQATLNITVRQLDTITGQPSATIT